jgi:hypothetical protein
MPTTSIPKPKFCVEHSVRFDGGEGIVQSASWEFGQWTYLVEMPLDTAPEFGRIGAETKIVLDEADLYAP